MRVPGNGYAANASGCVANATVSVNAWSDALHVERQSDDARENANGSDGAADELSKGRLSRKIVNKTYIALSKRLPVITRSSTAASTT